MEAIVILAKINTIFQICEKVAYGGIGVYAIFQFKKYRDDYVESIEEEKFRGGE